MQFYPFVENSAREQLKLNEKGVFKFIEENCAAWTPISA